jgi:hypothetical protein
VSIASTALWTSRLALALSLFSCHACSSGSGSEPATLTDLVVTPASPTVAVGHSRQLTATASYSDNTSANRTMAADWTSKSPGVATVAAGLVTGVSAGSAQVIAALGGMADTVTVSVTTIAPTLVGVTVSPKPATVAVGATTALAATADYSDSSFNTITAQAAWSSTAPGVATVSQGVVTGVSAGSVEIIATFNGLADTCQVTVTVSGPPGIYPLRVGPTSRYLVDQTGKPFFMIGDAAWSLIAQLPDSAADSYLAARQQLGFNTVLVNLLEHKFADNAPADYYNIPPFTGALFTTPNEAYFAHVDHILQTAAQKGLVVLLVPAYVGNDCSDEGWCVELQGASTADLTTWGQYVGNRYKDYSNIVWVVGGDADPSAWGVKDKLQAMVDGILQKDTNHLFTAHNQHQSEAIDPWTGASWLNVNNYYDHGHTLYQPALAAYQVTPTMPYFLIEAVYDGEGASSQELRAQSYWTALSGGFGHVYGDCPMWGFGTRTSSSFCSSTDWRAALTNDGSHNMQYLAQLFLARQWHLLVPDQAHTALTSGLSSGTDYATAAVASDGSSIIAYLPSARTVTVNGSALGPSMTAWWYDPSSGVSSSAGTFSTATTHEFTPPGSGDWVLVVDNTALNLPQP